MNSITSGPYSFAGSLAPLFRIRELLARPSAASVLHVHVSSGKDAGLDHEYELVDCITIVMCGGTTVALPATVKRVRARTLSPLRCMSAYACCACARAHVGRSLANVMCVYTSETSRVLCKATSTGLRFIDRFLDLPINFISITKFVISFAHADFAVGY